MEGLDRKGANRNAGGESQASGQGERLVRTKRLRPRDLLFVGLVVAVFAGALVTIRALTAIGRDGQQVVVEPFVPSGADSGNGVFTPLSENPAASGLVRREDQALLAALGPASDPDRLQLAETGELGVPALVWFHADWCHVCRAIEPEVVALGERFAGQIGFVRLNVDHAQSRAAVSTYAVRGTPTFVLFGTDGEVLAWLPGWPGAEPFVTVFSELVAENVGARSGPAG